MGINLTEIKYLFDETNNKLLFKHFKQKNIMKTIIDEFF